jgi:16S rRNA (cytosine967-C5)-methyltransferase
VAVERNPKRADELERNLERMRADWAQVLRADATDGGAEGQFHRVLLDAPCSALGTLRSRPDARWRKLPGQIAELQELQRGLLEAAAAKVRPGGTLVYSTCTISPSENEEQATHFLGAHPEFEADDLGVDHPGLRHGADGRFLQLLPHRDGTDGFFIARFRRRPA